MRPKFIFSPFIRAENGGGLKAPQILTHPKVYKTPHSFIIGCHQGPFAHAHPEVPFINPLLKG